MPLEIFISVILTGILASYVLLSLALWCHRLGLPRLDFSRAMTNLTYGESFGGEGPYWAGQLVIYFNGIIFALLFATWGAKFIGGFVEGPQLLYGAIWGVILWFFSGVFFVPLYLREGFFLWHIHKMAWASSLIVHGCFGLIVGWLSPVL